MPNAFLTSPATLAGFLLICPHEKENRLGALRHFNLNFTCVGQVVRGNPKSPKPAAQAMLHAIGLTDTSFLWLPIRYMKTNLMS